jgi:hypothetical protein
MAKLEEQEIQQIVDAVVAELDRRRQIEQLADAIIRKQGELNRRLTQAPQQYQRRQPTPASAQPGGDGQKGK